ncbi:hypothetical protein AAW51_5542 [Caldimonas brevitalea]|uniref:Uncharacterized protein n=1 Tax=Caldimonas brevitalea TaxID=413882 RepID=A0A0G3BW33_9BURK|nr:hypothetical protein AAW51_5542 [Caldimonas brevitalea]
MRLTPHTRHCVAEASLGVPQVGHGLRLGPVGAGAGSIAGGSPELATTPASDAPQPRQNRALSRLSVPHFGQVKLI